MFLFIIIHPRCACVLHKQCNFQSFVSQSPTQITLPDVQTWTRAHAASKKVCKNVLPKNTKLSNTLRVALPRYPVILCSTL